ncbi:OmpA family protein [Photobacterium japonica]|uniref:OmpA family protein n=1 Tax=Photobacterium japonica TaxID=2910235 RepID=UPI003D09F434
MTFLQRFFCLLFHASKPQPRRFLCQRRPVIPLTLPTILFMTASLLAGCGNGSDSVTNPLLEGGNTHPVNRSESLYLPDAKLLLSKLPEARTTVYFPEAQSALTVTDQLNIDPIAVRLRQHPDSYVLVIGHADEFTDENDNIALSFERAFSVAIYISSVFGVEEERIQLVSAGSSEKGLTDAKAFRRVDIISPEAIVRTFNPHPKPSF